MIEGLLRYRYCFYGHKRSVKLHALLDRLLGCGGVLVTILEVGHSLTTRAPPPSLDRLEVLK